jgi:ATP-dependent Lon protease
VLGPAVYEHETALRAGMPGVATVLAWTAAGGDILFIEATRVPGNDRLILTGQLGDVMKESAQAALTLIKSQARTIGIPAGALEHVDVHLHVPAGAIPKDGPSAGAAMTTAMVSALTGIAVRADVAMTGEITLRGEVLAIGGLKEKLLAAHRGGIKRVLIPQENAKDLADIPDNIKNRLDIHPVKWIDQVLEQALERMPEPLPAAAEPASVALPAVEPAEPVGAVKH